MKNKKTIVRISKYKNALKRFKMLGLSRVFSDNLAEAVGVSSIQVRKDFSLFGITGNKRGGYPIDALMEQLRSVLGKQDIKKVIIVGVGNMGAALIRYNGFERELINIVAGFDSDTAKLSPHAPIPILHIDKLENFVKDNAIKIGIIAVPDMAAQRIVDCMIGAGIKGILNFASIRLNAPEGCFINSVNLIPELESVIYFTKDEEKK